MTESSSSFRFLRPRTPLASFAGVAALCLKLAATASACLAVAAGLRLNFHFLWQNDDFSYHAVYVMKSTKVRVSSRLGKLDSETGYAGGGLCKTYAILWCRLKETGTDAVSG